MLNVILASVFELTDMAYVLASVLFILSLTGLSNQESARNGNFVGMWGMLIAILITFAHPLFGNTGLFFACFACGGLIGYLLSRKIEMTSMPQMIAMLHSFVGLAAVFVGLSNYLSNDGAQQNAVHRIEIFLGVFIGAVTVTGSLVAAGKLQGTISGNPLILFGSGRHLLNLGSVVISLVLMIVFCGKDNLDGQAYLYIMLAFALFLGWHLVMSIGGADMPVVVSMLNSYSGWATAASGFLLENGLLIIVGALVGSSGAILSYIMCRAMNRSFISVIAGGFGSEGVILAPKAGAEALKHSEVKVADTVELLRAAKSIIVVPGYGMAVARCQSSLAAVVSRLREVGKTVRFAIHPVAGRLPGHMNVLLAEAQVPYDIVLEMDEINDDFASTDVVLVIGANDTVNPASLEVGSTIYGMPVCRVWESKKVIVSKRSMATGYAGIENPLFFYENCSMLLGDAGKTVNELLAELTKMDLGNGAGGAAPAAAKPAAAAVLSEDALEQKSVVVADRIPTRRLGVPREVAQDEACVAVVPDMVKVFTQLGFQVVVEERAGEAAGFTDAQYQMAGAMVASTADVWGSVDVIVKLREPMMHPVLGIHEADMIAPHTVLISFLWPARNAELLHRLCARNVKAALAMDCVPRISRAQKLDALSSLAALAGHRAVVEAVYRYGRYLQGVITAAGKYPPAKVLIIGAGVAGLAALGTAKALGCVVRAFDTRPEVKEQVQSLGGEFLQVEIEEDGTGVGGYAKVMSPEFIKAEMELFANQAREVDIIITTANIPGRKAPVLVTAGTVRLMRRGSVVVDLAAANGGNCELTRPGELYIDETSGVQLIGYTNLPSRMAEQGSLVYCANLKHLLAEMGGWDFKIDMSNEVIGKSVVVHNGHIVWQAPGAPAPAPAPAPADEKKSAAAAAVATKPVAASTNGVKDVTINVSAGKMAAPAAAVPPPKGASKGHGHGHGAPHEPIPTWKVHAAVIIVGGLLTGLGFATPATFHPQFFLFVLAVIIGYHVIWSVTAALHTPLMSVTNAISGIIMMGSMLEMHAPSGSPSLVFGTLGVLFASINVVGGFFITYRMLRMFRK